MKKDQKYLQYCSIHLMKNTLCETSLISFYNRTKPSKKFNSAWFKLIKHLCSISGFKSLWDPLMRNAGFRKCKNTLMVQKHISKFPEFPKKSITLCQLAIFCWFITLPAMKALAVWLQGGLKGGSWSSQYWNPTPERLWSHMDTCCMAGSPPFQDLLWTRWISEYLQDVQWNY